MIWEFFHIFANLSKKQVYLVLRQDIILNLSRASLEQSAPEYFVFSGIDNTGFVIVAGDDVARPILGYSLDGKVENDMIPSNMQAWLDDMSEQIRYARSKGYRQAAETAQEWNARADDEIILQLETAQWDQGAPYNLQCPIDSGQVCVTGCVPTAYAILMKYYSYPLSGYGITKVYTGENGVEVDARNLEHDYQWDRMPMAFMSGEYTQEQADCVSQLMADIGAAIQADYSKDETVAVTGNAGVFRHFRFNSGTCKYKEDYPSEEWYKMLKAELEQRRPIIYTGRNASGESGHCYIIDGYTSQGYFCVNWGWGGYYNGAFAIDALTPGKHDYNNKQAAFFDSVPAVDLPSVAKVDNTIDCPSIKTAIAVASMDGEMSTVTMTSDAQINNATIAESQHVTLDINGHIIDVDQYGIYNYGHLKIMDSRNGGRMIISHGNTSIIANYGQLTVNGGEFRNEIVQVDSIDYRRCIWSAKESDTQIEGGLFFSTNTVICTNGNLIVNDGELKSAGNSAVLSNYNTSGTVTVNGGTFTNSASLPEDIDYRRCIWTKEGSNTIITGGVFSCNSTSQAFCFNGDASIEGGSVENKGSGYGCASNGNVRISDCRLSAERILYVWEDGSLKCSGGMYSKEIGSQFLQDGYECVFNDEVSTKNQYPYKVSSMSGIETLTSDRNLGDVDCTYFDLNGVARKDSKPGINIIRQKDGRAKKVVICK